MSSRMFWRPLSTVGNCGNWPSPLSFRRKGDIPGLNLDHPRQLAVMHALVRFSNIAAGGEFTTLDLHRPTLEALL
jgi:hypothetical protein